MTSAHTSFTNICYLIITTLLGYNSSGLSKIAYLVGKNRPNNIRRLMFRTILITIITVYLLFGIVLIFK